MERMSEATKHLHRKLVCRVGRQQGEEEKNRKKKRKDTLKEREKK